nr:MAG TPA: hypothetical protein [Crassvirales sp.]
MKRRKSNKNKNKPIPKLINKTGLEYVIKNSPLCQHAIKELELAGYDKNEDGPNGWLYNQVLEAIAVFSSHENSGLSANFEINMVERLCNYNVLSPLKFTDDEWIKCSLGDFYQNKRKSDVFKRDGKIEYLHAYIIKSVKNYNCNTKEWTNIKNPNYWNGGIFETVNGILTGNYFNICYIDNIDKEKGWMPKDTVKIECNEIEIGDCNYICCAEKDDINVQLLRVMYNIGYKHSDIIKDVRMEDMTEELEEKFINAIKESK